MKLDQKTVAGLTLPDGKNDWILFDEDLEGYGCRLRRRNGGEVRKTWIAQFRVRGRTRRVNLGPIEKLTPMQAREQARKVLAGAVLGRDPQAERVAQRQRAARTFRSAVDGYLADQQPTWRPESYRISKLYLTGSYFRPLHTTALSEITHADIAVRLLAIKRDHSAVTAAAARRALSAFFRWVVGQGLIPRNLVVGTLCPDDPEPRDRVLSATELTAIWDAAAGVDGDYGKILRLLILLAGRRQEIGSMRWSECDLEAGEWRLPANRSKNGKPLTLTLPKQALDIINTVARHPERDCLFGRTAAGFTNWHPSKAALDRRLGETVSAWRIHDLRRSAATRMGNDLGIEPHVIEALLNHSRGRLAETYNRSNYQKEVGKALALWADHVTGVESADTGTVVAFPAR